MEQIVNTNNVRKNAIFRELSYYSSALPDLNSQPLSSLEKNKVRDYLIECLINQFSQTELKQAKTLLQCRFNCTRQTIDGIHAQLTKELDYAFGSIERNPQLDATILSAARRLEDSTKQPYFSIVLNHLLNDLNISIDNFKEIFSRFKEMAGHRLHPSIELRSEHANNSNSGAIVSYDNPTKRMWRACIASELQNFLSRFTSQQIEKMRVVCLPSKNPEPELAMYLRAGIRPENIYAVEGGPRSVRQEFLANLSKLGGAYQKVNAVTMRLEDWLPTIEPTMHFDIVSYDFHGQFSLSALHCLWNVPLSSETFIVTNFLAKRETEVGSYNVKMHASFSTNPELTLETLLNNGLNLGQPRASFIKRHLSSTTLADARVEGLDSAVLSAVGNNFITASDEVVKFFPVVYKMINDRYFQKNGFGLESLPAGNYTKYLVEEMNSLIPIQIAALHHSFGDRTMTIEGKGQDMIGLSSGAAFASVGAPLIRSIRRFEYQSQSGTGKAPFYTTIGTLSRPTELYESVDRFVMFMLHAVCVKLGNPDQRVIIRAYDHKGRFIYNSGRKPHKTDNLIIENLPDHPLSTLPVKEFLRCRRIILQSPELIEPPKVFPSSGRLRIQ